jgi:hypothetical protein
MSVHFIELFPWRRFSQSRINAALRRSIELAAQSGHSGFERLSAPLKAKV